MRGAGESEMLPTREEIADTIRQAIGHAKRCVCCPQAADALLTRLRSAWDVREPEHCEQIGPWCAPDILHIQVAALRADLAEERKIVDRVWKAIGVETYEAADGQSIDALVAALRADMRAMAEIHMYCDGKIASVRE